MLTALDHIIIGVNNLQEATRVFDNLGLKASGGGIHPFGGTANRIIVIGDTYLELITVRAPSEAQQNLLDRLAKGDGYLNFVLSSNDIQADSAAIASRGVSIFGPTPGQLQSADGRVRGWSRTDIARPDFVQNNPFLIQHDSTGAERRQRLAGWTTPPAHPLGVTTVLSTTIAVAWIPIPTDNEATASTLRVSQSERNGLAEATARFQHIYGLQPSEPFTGEADGWDAMLVSFPLADPLAESGQSVELAAPIPFSLEEDIDEEHLPEPGALARYLQHYGESLCRMTLAVENLAASRQYLDEHQVTYTYVDMPRPVLWIHPDHACGASIVLHE